MLFEFWKSSAFIGGVLTMIASKYHLEMAWECVAAAEVATTPERRKALLEMAKLYTQTARQREGTTAPSPDDLRQPPSSRRVSKPPVYEIN